MTFDLGSIQILDRERRLNFCFRWFIINQSAMKTIAGGQFDNAQVISNKQKLQKFSQKIKKFYRKLGAFHFQQIPHEFLASRHISTADFSLHNLLHPVLALLIIEKKSLSNSRSGLFVFLLLSSLWDLFFFLFRQRVINPSSHALCFLFSDW